MKKTDTTEDPKVVFESNRTKLFQLPSRGQNKVINICIIIVRLATLKKK